MRRHFYAAAAVLFLFSATSLADEGFFTFTSQTPAAVMAVDPYTVEIWGDKFSSQSRGSLATAFLVKVKKSGNSTLGLFVTCAHVISSCNGDSCGMHLYHNYVNHGLSNMGPVPNGPNAWEAEIKKFVTADTKHDLSAFIAEIPSNLDNPPVLHIWTPNEDRTVYAIGTPDVTQRQQWHVPRPPTDPQLLWSYGQALLYQEDDYTNKVKQKVLLHTADILPGNSGGPLIDTNGRIIGVNGAAPVMMSDQKKGTRFVFENATNNKAIPAETVLQFLDTIQF